MVPARILTARPQAPFAKNAICIKEGKPDCFSMRGSYLFEVKKYRYPTVTSVARLYACPVRSDEMLLSPY
jgi:hypothetical protein